MTKKPLVSVIMPVYNAEGYLSQSIESTLNQSFTDFEFIIVDDASTDNSLKIIKSYAKQDKRIKVIKNEINLGVSLTANIATSKARGKYLARIDADDISLPQRFEKQLKFLQKHPSVIAVGSQCFVIDENNKVIGTKKFPINHKKLNDMIFWAVPMQQPSMMVNLQKLPKNFIWYSRTKTSAEDVDLFFRLMQYGQIANMKDYLLYYRILNNSLSHKNPKNTFLLTLNSRLYALKLGFKPSFQAVLINICQIIVISILPSSLINEIWSRLRGIKEYKPKYNLINELYFKTQTASR